MLSSSCEHPFTVLDAFPSNSKRPPVTYSTLTAYLNGTVLYFPIASALPYDVTFLKALLALGLVVDDLVG